MFCSILKQGKTGSYSRTHKKVENAFQNKKPSRQINTELKNRRTFKRNFIWCWYACRNPVRAKSRLIKAWIFLPAAVCFFSYFQLQTVVPLEFHSYIHCASQNAVLTGKLHFKNTPTLSPCTNGFTEILLSKYDSEILEVRQCQAVHGHRNPISIGYKVS